MAEKKTKKAAPTPDPVVVETPRRGLGVWARDDSWWRDVASQAVGGVAAAFVVAIIAGFAAWTLAEENRPWVILIGSAVGLTVVFMTAYTAWFFAWRAAMRRVRSRPHTDGESVALVFAWVLSVACAAVVLIAVSNLVLDVLSDVLGLPRR